MRRVVVLVAGVVIAWGCAAYPAWVAGGQPMLLQSALAAGLCLVPAALTLAFGSYVLQRVPELSMMVVAGSTAARMLFVVVMGLALTAAVPSFRDGNLWLWIVSFYFFTLALETFLLVRGRAMGRPDLGQHTPKGVSR